MELLNAIKDKDVVIHLAAKISVSESIKNPLETFRVNVDGTRNILLACKNNHVKKLIVASSAAVYGEGAYLVVRYEFTPGFDELDALSVGAQAHYWVGDFMKVGVTTNTNEEGDVDSSLNGADITLRKSADSWLKVQASRSEGLVSSTLRSDDGGFGFAGPDTTSFVDAEADGYRADLSVGFKDLYSRAKGQLTVYAQELDAGYSAPGLHTTHVGVHRTFAAEYPAGDHPQRRQAFEAVGFVPERFELNVGNQAAGFILPRTVGPDVYEFV